MEQSLAVKYRPKTLEDVIGQEFVVKVLKQQVSTNNIKHAYLFCGTSGSGKTTVGRILANLINKGIGYPIEFDAASNSSVEDVRTIINNSNTRSIVGEYKIYILDECHAFSNTAWQAFLKTLEEPNAKTIFIFCTTDPQKIPQTILNRVQRFDFTKIPLDLILDRLIYICNQEGFIFEEDALRYIAKISNGGMRNAITYLEKVASFDSTISLKNCVTVLGQTDYDFMFKLINACIDRDKVNALQLVFELEATGKDFKTFINDFTTFILDINKYLILRSFDNLDIPKTYEKELLWALNFEKAQEYYKSALEELLKLKEQTRFETDCRTNLQITVLTLCR